MIPFPGRIRTEPHIGLSCIFVGPLVEPSVGAASDRSRPSFGTEAAGARHPVHRRAVDRRAHHPAAGREARSCPRYIILIYCREILPKGFQIILNISIVSSNSNPIKSLRNFYHNMVLGF
ncbi:hypothetical protein HMI54_010437 [Coelomomyces lativittatus]|nr:hypothetical protein HMI54_010437 [Coelomomyces lativittatus]